jgi:glutamine amidotransferase
MLKQDVVVVDYGVGNLLSVQRALEECDAKVTVTSNPDILLGASKVILPGVGAFSSGMTALENMDMVEPLREVSAKGVPVLGICLGMQLLLGEGEEFTLTPGLKLIPGRVVPVPECGLDGALVKIPHIGWNALEKANGTSWSGPILDRTKPGDSVYFVHSFMAAVEDQCAVWAECIYGGISIPSVIGRDNVIGCQFHPEKSGEVGLDILRSFLSF